MKRTEPIIYSDKIQCKYFTHPSSLSLQEAVVHCLVVYHILGFISTILRMSLLLSRQCLLQPFSLKKRKRKKSCSTVHRLSTQQQITGSQQIAGAALKS